MLNIFISYSRKDSSIADKLEEDLKSQNVNLWIDRRSIRPGDIWIKEIDEALRKANYVLAILTKNYLSSYAGTWETYATLVEELQRKDIKWIPLYFESLQDLKLSPLLKSIQGINFFEDYDEGLKELLQTLVPEEERSKDLLASIEGRESTNPFRRVRAEYFDHDYKLLAQAFCEPEKEKYDLIKGRTPVIIFGGRGSGKTMILRSLSADTAVARTGKKSYKESKLNYFGIYLKLTRGCFTISGADILQSIPEKRARIIFTDDFNLKLAKLLIEYLQRYSHLSPQMIPITSQIEREVCEGIAHEIDPEMKEIPTNFADLADFIDIELKKLRKYVGMVAMGENPAYPGCYTDIEGFLSNTCKCLLEKIKVLNGSKIYFLLDEYENLMLFQQTVINTLVKLDTPYFTIKIASKFEGLHKPPLTLVGQALQEGHDYDTIEIDYDLSDIKQYKKYQRLLSGISRNILDVEEFQVKDIRRILDVPVKTEAPDEEINEELEKILRERGKDISRLTDKERQEHLNHMRMAIIFRLLRKHGKRKGKNYAGFEVFTYLSSGIVRFFLNLCGMSFYRAEDMGINVKVGERIPADCQTWAAYTVSEAYLEKIASNLEYYGESTQQLVADLGDIFRERLIFHTSEPEVLSLTIKDPHNLSGTILEKLLKRGVMESVFQEKKLTSSYRPKVSIHIRPREYLLNRIYSPALEISYRPRWRCSFSAQELTRLITPYSRKKQKAKLQKKQHARKKRKHIRGPKLAKFKEENKEGPK